MLTLLERLRLDARLTREQLAERSGVKVRTIRALERDGIGQPRLDTLVALADALDVQPSELRADFAAVRAEREAA